MYKELKDIFQFLMSVRKLKTYLTIDVEFPDHWKIPKKYVQEDKVVENERVNEGLRFFSFVCEFNEHSLATTVDSIKKIISFNKEIEMKEKLLKQKIDELKKIFQSEKLESLQSLKFDLIEEKLGDGEEIINANREGDRLVEE
jgi:hypothetical protein